MKNEIEIKKVFMKLIDSKPIESINVSIICEELKIKRQTFYYHYRDIFELVESILADYADELIVEDMSRYYLNKICDFVYENLYFFSQCIGGGLKEAVNNFFKNLILPYTSSVVYSLEETKELTNKDIKEIITYHSEALALFLTDAFKSQDTINLDHIINKIEIFLDKENLKRTAKLYYERRREL